MKKILINIVIGFVMLFLISMILSGVMGDSDLAFQISGGITMLYFITLTIISYFKNIIKYYKTGEFPDNSTLAIFVVGILAATTGKGLGSTIVMVNGADNASKEFKKADGKLGIFTYTLFYIALWSFLFFLFYIFGFQSDGLNSISETLLSISFISIILAVIIILIFGILANVKIKKSIMQDRENEYQELKKINSLAYDLQAFKKYYARPYYVVAYISILGLVLLIVGLLYNWIFDAYIADILGPLGTPVIYLLVLLAIFYLPFIFPIIIHTMKMNSKRQVITLNPLSVKMITKDGNDGYGNYEKVEKNYLINKINSYQITSRYFVINGEIETHIRKTDDYDTEEKYKKISQLKVPRIFSNENNLIEYLEKYKGGDNMLKKRGISKIALILIVALVIIIGVITIAFVVNKDKNENSNSNGEIVNKLDNKNQDFWGLKINGKSVALPCSLKDLKDANVNLLNEYESEKVINSSNTSFSMLEAGNDDWARPIYLKGFTNSDASKKEANVIVTVITNMITTDLHGHSDTSRIITKEQFHLKDGVAIGSTSDDVISAFGSDYTVYLGERNDKDLKNSDMIGIYYVNNDSALYLIFKKGILHSIEIRSAKDF